MSDGAHIPATQTVDHARQATRAQGGRVRTVTRLVRMTSAAALVVGVLAALAAVLWNVFGPPWPSSLPSLDGVDAWVDQPLTPERLFAGLGLVLWLLWALFVVAVAVECNAAIRRVRVARITLAAPLHKVAAGVAGIAATILTTSTSNQGGELAAAAATQPADAAPERGLIYETIRGDRFPAIADRFLDSPDGTGRILDLNPDLRRRRLDEDIEPGCRILLPADAHDLGPRPQAAGPVHDSAPPGPVQPRPSHPAGPATPSTPDTRPDTDPAESAPLALVPYAGAGLVASIALRALETDRRRQAQHRRTGQRLLNPDGGATERDLRVAQAPVDLDRLDLALRHLAATLVGDKPLPDVTGARVTGADVYLLLAHPHSDPPAPWIDEGHQWVLPGDLVTADYHPPHQLLPALAAVGSRAGRHLLVELERLGALTITGDPTAAGNLWRYLASELACNTWSHDVAVTIVGAGSDEATWLHQLNPDRITVSATMPDAVRHHLRHARATRQTLDALELADTLAGRISGRAIDAWTPHILLAANPTDADHRLLADLHRELRQQPGRCGVAVITTMADPHAAGPAVASVAADATLTLTTPDLTATAYAAALTRPELGRLAEILRLARVEDLPTDQENIPTVGPTPSLTVTENPDQTAASSDTADEHDPDPDLDQDLAQWTAGDAHPPRVAILGPVAITTNTGPVDRREDFHSELVLFLLAHPRGVDRWQLAEALWPATTPADSSVRVALTRVRQWLGRTPGDEPWLTDATDTRGIYRIQPGYLLDWHLFQRLLQRAHRRGPTGVTDLRRALALVRGQPFEAAERHSYGRSHYAWLSTSTLNPVNLVATIVDTAHALAHHCLHHGDTDGARWAVHQAWLADPDRAHDDPWLDLIHADHLDGHRAQAHQHLAELVRTRGGDVPEDLDPATYRQLQTLLPP